MNNIPFVREVGGSIVGNRGYCQFQFDTKVLHHYRGRSIEQVEHANRNAIPSCIQALCGLSQGYFVCSCGAHLIYLTKYKGFMESEWKSEIYIYELTENAQKVVSLLVEA